MAVAVDGDEVGAVMGKWNAEGVDGVVGEVQYCDYGVCSGNSRRGAGKSPNAAKNSLCILNQA